MAAKRTVDWTLLSPPTREHCWLSHRHAASLFRHACLLAPHVPNGLHLLITPSWLHTCNVRTHCSVLCTCVCVCVCVCECSTTDTCVSSCYNTRATRLQLLFPFFASMDTTKLVLMLQAITIDIVRYFYEFLWELFKRNTSSWPIIWSKYG